MFARPDPQSFTRFLASIGVFLCVVAFVGPALVIRETSGLRISTRDLDSYTRLARKELLRRQAVSRDAAEAAPWVGLALLVAGVALVVYAAPRLRRQEEAQEQRSSAELAKLMGEIEPQDQADREESLRADIAAEIGSEVTARDATSQTATLPAAAHPRERMRMAAEAERRALASIARKIPSGYELRQNVKVAGADALLLDGLLFSTSGRASDILIEIKLASGTTFVRNFRNRLDEALALQVRYRKRTNRPSVVWLILVLTEQADSHQLSQVRARAADFAEELWLTIITEDQIDELAPPVA